MCYNCGCEIPEDDMGYGLVSKGGGSLTEEDFLYVAKKQGTTIEDAKKNTYKLLKKQFEPK